MRKIRAILTDIYNGFFEDNLFRLSASLSFYTALSLAPLLVIVLSIAALVWGEEGAAQRVDQQVSRLIGPQAGETVSAVVMQAGDSGSSGWAAVIGVVMLLLGATAVFAELQAALNDIWGVKPNPKSTIWAFFQTRLTSLGLILSILFLLLVSLVLTTSLNFVVGHSGVDLPGMDGLWSAASFCLTLGVYAGLFTLIFKILPDAKIIWKHAIAGGLATAVLFAIGKELLAWYLGRGGVGSAYGAAGSLIVLLLWVYYSSMILFLGAEFTEAYTKRTGHPIRPAKHAVKVSTRG